jgi:hypothetical protein
MLVTWGNWAGLRPIGRSACSTACSWPSGRCGTSPGATPASRTSEPTMYAMNVRITLTASSLLNPARRSVPSAASMGRISAAEVAGRLTTTITHRG